MESETGVVVVGGGGYVERRMGCRRTGEWVE